MNQYLTAVSLPKNVDLQLNAKMESAVVKGPKFSMEFRRGNVVSFTGVDASFLIVEVFPNGVILTSSNTSMEKFYSWIKLFAPSSIWLDALLITGWFKVSR